MKKIIYLLIVLVLVSCTDQLTMEEVTEKATVQVPESNVDRLIEQESIKHNDPILEDAVTGILQTEVENYRKWSKAMVYVIETRTGRIKANVALERKGKKFIPYIDTYEQERSTMETASTYLALLSSGKVAPGQVFDTGYGIYGEVRDHNWRRGGYGVISLERGLEVHSEIALTMAKEWACGGNMTEFDAQINSYLAGKPNCALGLLTFYNAVANDGKMVKLVSEGEDNIVLQEQIANPLYIAQLQKGLAQCVSQGLMRKAGRDYVKVSANGRRIELNKKDWRLELFGYFPSENPVYTIMVILEKSYLPASAGGLCGPIFTQIIDCLVDSYGLQSMLTQEYEEVDEVIEIVDTVAVQ